MFDKYEIKDITEWAKIEIEKGTPEIILLLKNVHLRSSKDEEQQRIYNKFIQQDEEIKQAKIKELLQFREGQDLLCTLMQIERGEKIDWKVFHENIEEGK